MALRGTLTHRKTRRLAAALGIDPCLALGIMESLWHVTAEQAPQGDIGHMSNQDIADEIYYSGDPEKLIKALLAVGLLETSEECRLVVHHWEHHADQAVRRKLQRHGKEFKTGMTSHSLDMTIMPSGTGSGSGSGTGSGKKRGSGGKKVESETNGDFDTFWASYPRKIGKDKALEAWLKKHPPLEQCIRTLAWETKSPKWLEEDGKFIPHPATWLNQGRWQDEPAPAALPTAPLFSESLKDTKAEGPSPYDIMREQVARGEKVTRK